MQNPDPIDAEIAALGALYDQLWAAAAAGEDVSERWAAFECRRQAVDSRLAGELGALQRRRDAERARLRSIRREMRAMWRRNPDLPVPPGGVWTWAPDTPADVGGLVDLWTHADLGML